MERTKNQGRQTDPADRQSQTEPANPNRPDAQTDESPGQQYGQELQRKKDEERRNPGQQTGGTGGAGAGS